MLFANPDNIVNYVGAVLWFWSLLTVVGVIVLRFREPDLARPYRTWGYPVTPIIFGIVTLFCLFQNYDFHPTETLIGTATVLLGIPIYLWVSRKAPTERLRSDPDPLLEASN